MIWKPKQLIFTLKAQHRMLQTHLSLALESAKLNTKESRDTIASHLSQFQTVLQAHIKLEGEKFYQNYLRKKLKEGKISK